MATNRPSKYTAAQLDAWLSAHPDARRGDVAKGTARFVYNGGHTKALELTDRPVSAYEPTVTQVLASINGLGL